MPVVMIMSLKEMASDQQAWSQYGSEYEVPDLWFKASYMEFLPIFAFHVTSF